MDPDAGGLPQWLDALAAALGTAGLSAAERVALLDVARQAAHGVCRPAAPMTTYLIGVAVGRGADPGAAAEIATRLAAGWRPPTDPGPAADGPATGDGPAARPPASA